MSTETGWSDDPINKSEDDTLQRASLAQETALLMDRSTTSNASKVFGLTGPWGSGKTSLARLIENHLQDNFDGWKTAHFTPWAATDTQSMMAEFVASLVDILPGRNRERALKIIGKGITFGAPAVSAALSATMGAPSTKEVTKKIGELLTKQESWDKTFQRLSRELEESSEKALILVDDIDRLDREQLALLLKIVRLLGRFPGIHYLLMYDEATLFETLSGARDEPSAVRYANRYMEKIVQYQVPVPPMSSYQIGQRLQHGLDGIASRQNRAWHWEDRAFQDVKDILPTAFSTPRSIDRYLVQLERVVSLHTPEEINDTALMLLTALQTEDPTVYSALPRAKAFLTRKKSTHFSVHAREEIDPDWEKLLGCTAPWAGTLTETIVNRLFPVTLPKNQMGGMTSRNSVHHADYFDRYFVHSIHGNDVRDASLDAALAGLTVEGDDRTGLVTLFQGLTSDEQKSVALDRLKEKTRLITADHENAVPTAMIEGISRLIAYLPEQAEVWRNPREHAFYWLTDSLMRISVLCSPTDLTAALDHVDDLILRVRALFSALQEIRESSLRGDPDRRTRISILEKTGMLYTDVLMDRLFALLGEQVETSGYNFRLFRLSHLLSSLGDAAQFRRRMELFTDGRPTQVEIAACFALFEPIFNDNNDYRIVGFNQEGLRRLWPDLIFDFRIGEQRALDPMDTSWRNVMAFAEACMGDPGHAAAN